MNIYNFIFCYFYNKADYPKLGRMYGSAHVLFLIEIIYCTTGYKIHLFPESVTGSLFHRKQVYFVYSIPFFIISWLYYNNERTEKILEKFNDRDEYIMQGDSNRAGIYILGPFLATIVLICLKQYEII